MLVGFSVSNFKSFKDPQKISMISSKVARHKSHVITTGKRKLLKSAVVFGANAGGKSNFIKAIDFSRKIILQGTDNINLEKNYFRISDNMYKEPAGKYCL